METNSTTWRVDKPYFGPPAPKMFDLPNRYEIQRLLMLLDDDNLDWQKFAVEMAPNAGLQQYILAHANYFLPSRDNRIHNAVHAFAYLGMGRLKQMLHALTARPEAAAS
jgi:hypothetical protein